MSVVFDDALVVLDGVALHSNGEPLLAKLGERARDRVGIAADGVFLADGLALSYLQDRLDRRVEDGFAELVGAFPQLGLTFVPLDRLKRLSEEPGEHEVEAEAVAYIAGRYFKLETSGSAFYAASHLTNESVTQQCVSEVAQVSKVTIRDRYQELLDVQADI